MNKFIHLIIALLLFSGCASLSITGLELVNQMYGSNLLTAEEKNAIENNYDSTTSYLLEPFDYKGLYDTLDLHIKLLSLTPPSTEIVALSKLKLYTYQEWQKALDKRKFLGMTLQGVSVGVNSGRSNSRQQVTTLQSFNNQPSPFGQNTESFVYGNRIEHNDGSQSFVYNNRIENPDGTESFIYGNRIEHPGGKESFIFGNRIENH